MTPHELRAKRQQLEPSVRAFLESLDTGDFGRISLDVARDRVHQAEGSEIDVPETIAEDISIRGTIAGPIPLRVVRHVDARGWLPAIVYLHGGGWVFGDERTHDWIVRALATATRAAVVFVDYHRAPDAKFPIALEEAYDAVRWIADCGGAIGIDGERIAIAGDSAGGNLATGVCVLAGRRGGPRILHQTLLYPSTDALHRFPSFTEYRTGFYLTAESVRWSQSQYLSNEQLWTDGSVSPLRARFDWLRGLPPALVITAELDPLRDEGEAYARRLRESGVDVVATRYIGTIHAFLSLRVFARTMAPATAIAQIAAAVRSVFG